MCENLHSCSWSIRSCSKGARFPVHLRRQRVMFGKGLRRLGCSSQTAVKTLFEGEILPTVLMQLPAHLKALDEQFPWGLPSRMCWAGLRETPWHCGVRRSSPSCWIGGVGLCVSEKDPAHCRPVFASEVSHTESVTLPQYVHACSPPSSCSLIVFPKIPEQQSRWKPYLNLETVNTTCWAQWSNWSRFPLNDIFFLMLIPVRIFKRAQTCDKKHLKVPVFLAT